VNVLLGVCGGIAAYKSAELVRRLQDAGHEVQVVMTRAAREFVTPLTFETLSGRPVGVSLFDVAPDAPVEHIRLARWSDALVVAPATAHTIGRMALGLADDLLSTVVLATERDVPLVLAPAMNTVMWTNPLVQQNLARLRETRAVVVVEPREATLACRETGAGAMADPERIVRALDEGPGRAS